MNDIRKFMKILEDFQRTVLQIDTPAFKRWFRNSKIVDKTGNPQIVYHGTGYDFSRFIKGGSESGHRTAPLGFWFTNDHNVAEHFADWARGPSFVMPVYLSIQNPKIYTAHGEFDSFRMFIRDFNKFIKFECPDYMMPAAKNDKNEIIDWEPINMINDKVDVDGFRSQLESQGYDGIIIKNTKTDSIQGGPKIDQFIAFSPTQIKSAVGNSGSFDIENDDITEGT